MSVTVTHGFARQHDHFEPEAALSPQEQRQLRAHLEQIDYAAYAANREILGKTLGAVDLAKFQRLAVAAAHARAEWAAAALAMTAASAQQPSPAQVSQLAALRKTYEEMSEAYEAMRRMVERGYLAFRAAP
ncbi:MAG: hypothetical protein AB7M12_03805 [Hyphomonadaceae bacterium]